MPKLNLKYKAKFIFDVHMTVPVPAPTDLPYVRYRYLPDIALKIPTCTGININKNYRTVGRSSRVVYRTLLWHMSAFEIYKPFLER